MWYLVPVTYFDRSHGRPQLGSGLLTLTLSESSSSPPLWSIRLEGGKRLADLVDQLTLECCHSFRFYSRCRKRIPIRDSSMPKRILSQCGVSSDVFISLIVPTTRVLLSAGIKRSLIGISTDSFKILNIHKSLEFFRLVFKSVQPKF